MLFYYPVLFFARCSYTKYPVLVTLFYVSIRRFIHIQSRLPTP
jgi:hypothetical protein